MRPCQKLLKSTPKPAWGPRAWGAGPASEPMTLPFRQPKAEDQEIPVVSTGNVQVTQAGEGSAGTSYCPQNPLERGLWVQAGVGVLGGGGAEPEPPQTWSQPPYPQSEPRVGGAPQSCLLPAPKASTAASKTAQTGPRRGAAPRGAEREASAAHCPADPEAASIRQGHRG